SPAGPLLSSTAPLPAASRSRAAPTPSSSRSRSSRGASSLTTRVDFIDFARPCIPHAPRRPKPLGGKKVGWLPTAKAQSRWEGRSRPPNRPTRPSKGEGPSHEKVHLRRGRSRARSRIGGAGSGGHTRHQLDDQARARRRRG